MAAFVPADSGIIPARFRPPAIDTIEFARSGHRFGAGRLADREARA